MTSVERRAEGTPASLAIAFVLLGSTMALAVGVVLGRGVMPIAAVTLGMAIVVVWYRRLARWPTLVGAIVLIIMFIPIKQYKIAAGLPFDLEPYRIALAVVAALWIAAALTDPRTRLRQSFLDKPLLLVLAAVIGSILTNVGGIGERDFFLYRGEIYNRGDLSGDVLKKVLFLLSFFVFFYFVVSVVRTERMINAVVKTVVAAGGLVACAAIIEARTNYNVFNHIGSVFPVLQFQGAIGADGIARGGRLRVYASAQHPIALAVMFVMLIPLAFYLLRHTGNRIWAVVAVVLGLGAIGTVSRTSITTMAAALLVFIWLRPREIKRLIPLLPVVLVIVHLAVPGALGGIRQAFFPPQGLVSDQTVYGGRVSSERLGPEFDRIRANPLFGQGYGTRITEIGLRKNARVLDDEWLGTASETGLIGLFAWLWFFIRFVRRTGKEAMLDLSSRGWLLVSLAAGAAAFAVGMLTYDAFSFIQVTFVVFLFAALGVCTLEAPGPWASARGPATASRLGEAARQLS